MLSVSICIILVITVFFILGLDKVIIKPLVIKDYAISNKDEKQSELVTHTLTTNSFILNIYEK